MALPWLLSRQRLNFMHCVSTTKSDRMFKCGARHACTMERLACLLRPSRVRTVIAGKKDHGAVQTCSTPSGFPCEGNLQTSHSASRARLLISSVLQAGNGDSSGDREPCYSGWLLRAGALNLDSIRRDTMDTLGKVKPIACWPPDPGHP